MKLTAREEAILALVPTDGSRINTNELIKAFFGADPPLNARPNLISRLKGIALKLERNPAPGPRLFKSPRSGPRPSEFWIEHK